MSPLVHSSQKQNLLFSKNKVQTILILEAKFLNLDLAFCKFFAMYY